MNLKKLLEGLTTRSQFEVVEVTSENMVMTANGACTVTVPTEKSGYKFLGVVGYRIEQVSGSNGRINIYRLEPTSSGIVCSTFNMHTSAATVKLNLIFLYQKVGG